MGIAAVDDDIAGLKARREAVDHVIHRRARLHHHEDNAGLAHHGDKIIKDARAGNAVAPVGLQEVRQQVPLAGDIGVEHSDRAAAPVEIEGHVPPHDPEAHDADVAVTQG